MSSRKRNIQTQLSSFFCKKATLPNQLDSDSDNENGLPVLVNICESGLLPSKSSSSSRKNVSDDISLTLHEKDTNSCTVDEPQVHVVLPVINVSESATPTCSQEDISLSKNHKPVQPCLKAYPYTGKRKFSSAHYSNFNWLEYSVTNDSVFCFACRHFAPNIVLSGEQFGNVAFVDYGLRKWKDMKSLCMQHNNSQKHKSATASWNAYQSIQKGEAKSMGSAMNSSRDKVIEENRNHVRLLLKVTCFLGRQGLAFRGDNECADSNNRGNFLELLKEMAENYPEITDRLAQRYGHYTSPEYQNDLIHTVATCIRHNITNRVARYFSILVDECKDRSKKEQLSLVLRYTSNVTNCNGKSTVHESCIGSHRLEKLDASAIFDVIDKAVNSCKLDWADCVAQCYDGASVMSGELSGVQIRVKQKAPHAIYIHCHAHRLNLVLVETLQDIQAISQFFAIVQALYVFLTRSNPRHELFIKAQEHMGLQALQLERLIETRWSYWYNSVRKIYLRYSAIKEVLYALTQQNADSTVAAEALGYLTNIDRLNFITILITMMKLLGKVNSVSKELQSPKVNMPHACDLMKTTRKDVLSLRSDEVWNEIMEESRNLAEANGVSFDSEELVTKRPVRNQCISRKLTDYFVASTIGKQQHCSTSCASSDIFKREILFAAVDRFINELDKRFGNKLELLAATASLQPGSDTFLDVACAQIILNHYSHLEIDKEIISSQLESAKSFLEGKEQVKDIHTMRDTLCKLPEAFSEVLKLIDLVLTLPITTATNERLFSCMKRVKNYLRTSTGDDRLSDLLVMASQPEEVKAINLEQAVDMFANAKSRRYPLLK